LENDYWYVGMFLKLPAATDQPLIPNETSVGAGFHACPQQQIRRYLETGGHSGLPVATNISGISEYRRLRHEREASTV